MDIKIRPAKKEDAPFIGKVVAGAIGEELCKELSPNGDDCDVVLRMFSELAAREDSQYSYKNALIAENDNFERVGGIVGYDGADLIELRKRFIDKANEHLGWNVTYKDAERWEAETNESEFYLDSLFVIPEYRHSGLGSLLIKSMIEKNESKGKPFGLLCDPDNMNALKLYERLGFRRDGYNSFCGTRMIHLKF